jgi:hypothetical protein
LLLLLLLLLLLRPLLTTLRHTISYLTRVIRR